MLNILTLPVLKNAVYRPKGDDWEDDDWEGDDWEGDDWEGDDWEGDDWGKVKQPPSYDL